MAVSFLPDRGSPSLRLLPNAACFWWSVHDRASVAEVGLIEVSAAESQVLSETKKPPAPPADYDSKAGGTVSRLRTHALLGARPGAIPFVTGGLWRSSHGRLSSAGVSQGTEREYLQEI